MNSKLCQRGKLREYSLTPETPQPTELCAEPLFLRLPIEVRLRIYETIMPKVTLGIRNATRGRNKRQSHIKFISKLGRSKDQLLEDNKSLQGLISLFFTNKVLSAESVEYFYSRVTFAFTTIKTINYFLNRISAKALHAITSVYICYTAYGEPHWTKDLPLKELADKAWDKVCVRMAKELISLKAIELHLHLADWPIQLDINNENVSWARPLLHFRSCASLENATVRMVHFMFGGTQCLSASLQVERNMIAKGRRITPIEKRSQAVLGLDRCLRGAMANNTNRKPQVTCRKESKSVLTVEIPEGQPQKGNRSGR